MKAKEQVERLAAVWQRESSGDYCAGNCGHVYQYFNGGGVFVRGRRDGGEGNICITIVVIS